jgi:GMP synthase (glutamine-hydrolysing)
MQKLLVIDYWSQYTHLITSRFRHLWIYTEIIPALDDLNEEDLNKLSDEINSWILKWIILSWWPNSVYNNDTLTLPKSFFDLNIPILAICYGHQLTHYVNGWEIKWWDTEEYWEASLKIVKNSKLFKNIESDEIVVWMSHWDSVVKIAEWFSVIWSTDDCKFGATSNEWKNIYTLQFHPEVSHTQNWIQILKNFANICNIEKEWSMEKFLEVELEQLKKQIWTKNVFLFISGWVDSTVAYFLINKAIWADRIYPVFVDTWFMRKDEAIKVEKLLSTAWVKNLQIIDAKEEFLSDLEWISEPETKRKIIWDKFIKIQARIAKELWLDTKTWLLAQWTIYPDTIESGWTKNAKTIKTHHNRVPEIRKMIEAGLIVEPLNMLYKDEVRSIWSLMWIWNELIDRHPFPWPGLSLRILCSDEESTEENFNYEEKEIYKFFNKDWVIDINVKILEVKSVWVQWDNRSYKHPIVLTSVHWFKNINFEDVFWENYNTFSTYLTNNFSSINRVLLNLNSIILDENVKPNKQEASAFKLQKLYLTDDRIKLLQSIDDIVEKFLIEKNYRNTIWQFPVVLIPVWSNWKESIVLRPIDTLDAMTATFSKIKINDLKSLVSEILQNLKIETVFYDLTWKPPGTIEWE